MTSIKELRKICFKGNHPMNFYRNISIQITRLLIHTPISANFITFFYIVLGIIGAFLLGSQTYSYRVLGAVFVFLVPILDYVDGEVARYKKTHSPHWGYVDWVGYWVIIIISIISITYLLVKVNTIYYLIGFLALAAFSMNEFIRLHQFRLNKHILKESSRVRYPKLYKFYLFLRKLLMVEYIHFLLLIFVVFNIAQFYLFYMIVVFNSFWITKVIYNFFFGYKIVKSVGVKNKWKRKKLE